MGDVVIVEAVRTPVGKRNGKLKEFHPVTLGSLALREVVHRAGIEPKLVEEVVMGCVLQVGEQTFNIARNVTLLAGFPIEVPATTVDRQCGSGQQAIHFAASLIQAGVVDIAIGGGVESMSRVPMGTTTANGQSPFPAQLLELYPMVHQGSSAEMIAHKWKISRQEMDAFGARSQQLAAQATDAGYFKREIMPVSLGDGSVMTEDEGIRRGTTAEALASLKLAFQSDGVITAGNSSQISDGAAAVLLISAAKAQELGLRPRARIVAQKVVGVDPVIMLTGPIPGTQQVLTKAGLQLADIDLFEINEAFASVVLAWEKEIQPDMNKVNVNGGAIALGHPLGCSGARLLTTLLHELERRNARYGLQAMCCGGGLGTATIIERL